MTNKRPQKHKGTENKPYIIAMRELRRSNAATPYRNKTKFDRNDYRRQKQSGRSLDNDE